MEAMGVAIARYEHIDQEVPLDGWTTRMRCDSSTVKRLEAMLQEQPLKGFVRSQTGKNGFAFTLREAIIIAGKPVQE